MEINSANLRRDLQTGLNDLQLSFGESQLEQLELFIGEFNRWNIVHNLTAIEAYEEFLSVNIFDSLSIVRPIENAIHENLIPPNARMADLGAGGGFPSILLAIFLPSISFVLVEAVRKKAAFLLHIKGRLKLSNVQIIDQRVESYSLGAAYTMDGTISRAFTELKNFVQFSKPLLKPSGVIFAMKSQKIDEELRSLDTEWEVLKNMELKVPQLDAFRCLVFIRSVRK